LAIASLSAALANLVNNLPASLVILPLVAAAGPGPVLAMLIGVGVGPNLTSVGSLATLLWRRIVHAHEQTVDVRDFVRLGVLTVTRCCSLRRWRCGWLCTWSDARGRVDLGGDVEGLHRPRAGAPAG
jgi:hypothetical protein